GRQMRAPSVFALSVLVLSGCGTTEAQHHVEEIGKTARAAMEQNRQCQSTLEANPRYTRIYQKLGVSTAREPLRAPTAAQLSDSDKVSDEDKSLGFEWYAEGQNCAVSTIEALGRLDPEFQIYFADRLSELADVLNDIATNELTFGQVNTKIASLKQHSR